MATVINKRRDSENQIQINQLSLKKRSNQTCGQIACWGKSSFTSDKILTATAKEIGSNKERQSNCLFVCCSLDVPVSNFERLWLCGEGKAAYLQYSGEEETSESVSKEKNF